MSLRFDSLLLACLGLFALGARPTTAAVPSPANSSVPACFVSCPAGDVPFVVVVRDIAHGPVAGSSVRLEFVDAPALPVCQGCCEGLVIDQPGRSVYALTDASGVANIALKMGGFIPFGFKMNVYADGVLLSPLLFVSSPDVTGNGVVDWGDVSELSALFEFPAGVEIDFDCDGGLGMSDFDFMMSGHMNHLCDAATPAQRRTWGALKGLYR